MSSHLESNRRLWDEWTRVHETSDFYDLDGFKRGVTLRPGDVAPGVRLRPYEVEEVGEVAGRDLLHLQCHFGIDTLSWARLGAKVTGLDFSSEAIDLATRLADEMGLEARFVHANVYDARDVLSDDYDIVYTSRGVLWWLPDIGRWARVVYSLLRPGGILYLTEFHPFVQVFDEAPGTTEPRLKHPYFPRPEPMAFAVEGSYADPSASVSSKHEYGWVHSLAEIVTSVVRAGLAIDFLHEFDRTAHRQLPFLVPDGDGSWGLPDSMEGELPLMFSLRARKPGRDEGPGGPPSTGTSRK